MKFTSVVFLASSTIAAVTPPLPTQAPELAARQCGSSETHVVTSAENLNNIASSLGVGVCNIATSNAITDINSIFAGQTLTYAPSGCEAPVSATQCCLSAAAQTTHVVVGGDSLWDLSLKNGVALDALVSANPNVGSVVSIGAEITIPARSAINC